MFDTPAMRRCLRDRFYPGDISDFEKNALDKKNSISDESLYFLAVSRPCIEDHAQRRLLNKYPYF